MKIRKIFASLMAVTVLGSAIPAVSVNMPKIAMTANAEVQYPNPGYEYTDEESNLNFAINDDTIEIIGCDDSTVTKIEIPAELRGRRVTSIRDWAFSGCTALTEIIIPENVMKIGYNAFGDTPWLENKRKENPLVIVNGILIDGETCSGDVVIPKSVTSINEYAFSRCTSMTKITIPESVSIIGEHAFDLFSALKEITILDPECEINADVDFSLVVKGYSGSTAQAWAKKNYAKFESLGEAPTFALGDINGDKTIDSSDATVVLTDYSLTSTGKSSKLTSAQKIAADIDKDGKIDSSDASTILQFYSYISTGGTETDMSKWLTK